jgi:lipid-A-disaccharide synthase
LPILLEAVRLIKKRHPVTFVLPLPAGFGLQNTRFWKPVQAESIQVIEGHTWDALAQAELALAASGTVTIEAAMLGTPMVTFYRVNALSWYLGRWLVVAPFLSAVNMVAGRRVVPELIQQDMTAERIAYDGLRLLENSADRAVTKAELADVARKLSSERDPMEIAAEWVERVLGDKSAHAMKASNVEQIS